MKENDAFVKLRHLVNNPLSRVVNDLCRAGMRAACDTRENTSILHQHYTIKMSMNLLMLTSPSEFLPLVLTSPGELLRIGNNNNYYYYYVIGIGLIVTGATDKMSARLARPTR